MASKLEELRKQLTDVLNEHEKSVQRHRADLANGHLTREGYEAAVARDRDRGQWSAKIDAVDAEISAWMQRAEANTAKARTALTTVDGTATEQLLAETRAMRAWQRWKPVLDTEDPVTALTSVLDGIRTTSGEERRALLEEAPSYLRTRGVADIDEEVDRTLADADPQFGYAKSYEPIAAGLAGNLQAAAQTTRDHIMGVDPAGARTDMLVREMPLDASALPTDPSGNRGSNGNWDSALQEFRP